MLLSACYYRHVTFGMLLSLVFCKDKCSSMCNTVIKNELPKLKLHIRCNDLTSITPLWALAFGRKGILSKWRQTHKERLYYILVGFVSWHSILACRSLVDILYKYLYLSIFYWYTVVISKASPYVMDYWFPLTQSGTSWLEQLVFLWYVCIFFVTACYWFPKRSELIYWR